MDGDAPGKNVELEAREVRVLGCLIEKDLSTPEYYPMTLNSLTNACNQKTNREPVVEYEEADVAEALDSLHRKRMVGHASIAHGRAPRYRHALAEVMQLKRPHLAVLASLMLRGPETSGEIRSRTSRMHEFESLDAVDAVLAELAEREPPLVTQLPRKPGQKEARYAHLLAGEPSAESADAAAPSGMAGRVEQLEAQVAKLREHLEELQRRFESFRGQFE